MSFTPINQEDFVVSTDSITAPAWSSNIPTLSSFYTASGNSYYLDVYNTASSDIAAAVQFSIAYANKNSLGSSPINPLIASATPTRINFGQFRNLVYGDSEAKFSFGSGNSDASGFVAITIDRNRYKGSLFPGSMNLTLSNGVDTIKLSDNSKNVSVISYLDCGRVYDVVSGSDGTAASNTLSGYTTSGSYGLFLPDIGTIILNQDALALSNVDGGLGLTFPSGSENSANDTIYEAIKAGGSFKLLSEEQISSNYIFIRVKNGEYNYTSNPSFITGSGDLIYSNFINSPQVFPTTVGIYNQNNELLAVAKMSKPLKKDFTSEALIRVKLDW